MPVAQASLVWYLSVGMALVGAGVFLMFVILATVSFSCCSRWPVLSSRWCSPFWGIRHLNQLDEEARILYPLWDQGMAQWTRPRFCTRDHVVFDPQSNQVLSNAAVKELLDLNRIAEEEAIASP